jgi:hypothetical protein
MTSIVRFCTIMLNFFRYFLVTLFESDFAVGTSAAFSRTGGRQGGSGLLSMKKKLIFKLPSRHREIHQKDFSGISETVESGVTRWVCEKIAQNLARPIFCQNYYTVIAGVRSSSKLWATFAIFLKTTKENNRPIGENSPNLVNRFPPFVTTGCNPASIVTACM